MEINVFTADVLRYFCLFQAAIIASLTLIVFFRYAIKIYAAKPEDRALPTHVALISLSYMGLVVIAVIELWQRFGDTPSWRLPLDLILFTMGNGALIYMLIHLSLKRTLVKAVLERARIETEQELLRETQRQSERIDRMERVGQKTSDSLTELREETSAAKDTAREVSDKADVIGESTKDTNTRVRDIQGKGIGVAKQANTIDELSHDTNERVRDIQDQGNTP